MKKELLIIQYVKEVLHNTFEFIFKASGKSEVSMTTIILQMSGQGSEEGK